MDNKELYEILQEYADDVKAEKESAFKKLNEQPKEDVKQSRKRFKPQYAFAIAMCMVVVVLCIALPIALTDKPHGYVEPTYCSSGEIIFGFEGNSLADIEKYHIDAYYPTLVTDKENMAVCSILSDKDTSLHGIQIGYVLEEDEDEMTFIELAIVPKTHILQIYEDYFDLQEKIKWNKYDVKYFRALNQGTLMYDMQIYFTDGKYDYFITVESDEEMDTSVLLNLLYN